MDYNYTPSYIHELIKYFNISVVFSRSGFYRPFVSLKLFYMSFSVLHLLRKWIVLVFKNQECIYVEENFSFLTRCRSPDDGISIIDVDNIY